ncbi:hypothetical protein V499_04944, partial [Pseudogymnoascus sp. VKM F-103]
RAVEIRLRADVAAGLALFPGGDGGGVADLVGGVEESPVSGVGDDGEAGGEVGGGGAADEKGWVGGEGGDPVCLVRQPGLENETTLSRIVRLGFPRHAKHIVSLLSVITDDIACLSMISTSDRSDFLSLAAETGGTGRPARLRRKVTPSSTVQYAVTALIAVILRRSVGASRYGGACGSNVDLRGVSVSGGLEQLIKRWKRVV